MAEVTGEELAAMTDRELWAYEREHHGDPYVTLLRAKGMQRVGPAVLACWGGPGEGGQSGRGGGAASPASEVVSVRLRRCR
jgi:hypothetical protein